MLSAYLLLPIVLFIFMRWIPSNDIKKIRLWEDYTLLVVYLLNSVFASVGCFKSFSILLEQRFGEHLITPEIISYNEWQLAFYVSLIFMISINPKKSDYKIMLFHHCITLLVIYVCIIQNFQVPLCIILYIHDICDVFLQLSSISHRHNSPLQYLFFILFTISFVVLRLIFFPFILFWYPFSPANTIPYILCGFIWSLHVYWSHTIFSHIYRFINTNEAPMDDRETKEN